MPVSDATPLIYLSRLGELHLLRDVFAQVQIPPEVKVEVVDRGKAEGYSDAYVIEQALNEGWLILTPLTTEDTKESEALAQMTGIDIGEAQAIILTKQKGEKLVFIDQSNARQVARHVGLTPRGTIFVILTATKRKLVTKEDAKQMLEALIEANFYVSAKIYGDTLKAIEKL
ncbi:MAG: hypothetical protein AOA65_0159 [Candidatus Bathyarchaeota archaeon BA1]|nr:MAG: hypothetical protein AOA65_0159 [Candidatus Bathyarchaeota archaeon BA1]